MYEGYLVRNMRKSCGHDKAKIVYVVIYKAVGSKQKRL